MVWRDVAPLLRDTGSEVHVARLTGVSDRAHLLDCGVDLSTHVTDVAGLIRYEDLSEVVLVGHSYGGMVIAGVAARVPERIGRLVYLDAYLPKAGQSEVDLWPEERRAAMDPDASEGQADGQAARARRPAWVSWKDPSRRSGIGGSRWFPARVPSWIQSGVRKRMSGQNLPSGAIATSCGAAAARSWRQRGRRPMLTAMRALTAFLALELVLLVAGPAAAWLEIVPPMVGLSMFALGGLMGIAVLVAGVVVSFVRRRRGASWGAPLALAGVGALGVIPPLTPALGARGLPPINDVTTSPADPPEFEAIAELPENHGRDMSYPAGFADQQRSAYALEPVQVSVDPSEALQRARAAAEELGWSVMAMDMKEGRLEATDHTRVFRFADDVVVRVRPAPEPHEGALIDVRSKSRDGKDDLGANAARVQRFMGALVRR